MLTCEPIIGDGPNSALQGLVLESGFQILGESRQIPGFAPEIFDELPRLQLSAYSGRIFIDGMFMDDLINKMFMDDLTHNLFMCESSGRGTWTI